MDPACGAGGRPARTIHAAAGRAGDLRPLQGRRRAPFAGAEWGSWCGSQTRSPAAAGAPGGQQRPGRSFGAWTCTPPNGDIQTRHAAKSRRLVWLSSIDGITLSDREGHGEHTPSRRSARLAGRRRSPLEACRSGALCAWRRPVADERAGVRGLSWSQPCWGPQRIPSSSVRLISMIAAYRRVPRNVAHVR